MARYESSNLVRNSSYFDLARSSQDHIDSGQLGVALIACLAVSKVSKYILPLALIFIKMYSLSKKNALQHCRIMVYLPSEYREVPPVDLLSWLFDNTGVDVEKDVRILSRTHNTICCILISTDPD